MERSAGEGGDEVVSDVGEMEVLEEVLEDVLEDADVDVDDDAVNAVGGNVEDDVVERDVVDGAMVNPSVVVKVVSIDKDEGDG